jgi:hypothetical protein
MAQQLERPALVHVRFDGRSFDVPLADLNVAGPGGDNDIKRAVARHLEIPEVRLHNYVLDRHETGNVTIRPAAVFG